LPGSKRCTVGDVRLSEAEPPAARLWVAAQLPTLSALLPLSQETLIYVAEEDGKVVGFIQARASRWAST